MKQELEYRPLLAIDIERSSGRGNAALFQIREVLREALRAAFERSAIDWSSCRHDDLGDGARVIAPAGLRKSTLIHPLIYELAVRLRAHNRMAGASTAVRVRAALHAGAVHLGTSGVTTGGPLEVLARMLDAPQLRTALADAPDDVSTALLISQHVYDETVRHGYPGIDPDSFRTITFSTKGYGATGWLHLSPNAPRPQSLKGSSDSGDPAGGWSRMDNRASGHGVVYATQNGNQYIHVAEHS